MNNLKSFNNFINENNSNLKINKDNLLELKSKISAIIAINEDADLRKGLDFAVANINDYGKDDFATEMIDLFIDKINNLISKNFPKFWSFDDKGYSGYKFTGNNYELTRNMDIKELSKLVKKELSIEFPEWKFSVKIERFAGGQSMNVYIVDMPYNPFSEEADAAYKADKHPDLHTNQRVELYNPKYLADSKKINKIIKQYNYDDSDSQTDYFDVRYYSHLKLEDSIKAKYYPNNADVQKSIERNKQWDDQAKKQKEARDAVKSKYKYKKGDQVIYIYDRDSVNIPKGEYEAIILKAPNGRGMFPKYEIKFKVEKIKRNGNIVDLEKPQYYLATIYDDKFLKEKGA